MRNTFKSTDYTKAPRQMEFSRMIPATPHKIWKVLSSHEAITNWIPLVKSSTVINTGKDGKKQEGTIRNVKFGKDTLKETIVFWDETFGYAYSIADMHIVKNHVGHFSISEKLDGTLVSWSQYYEPQGNALKRWMAGKVMLPSVMKKALKNLDKSVTT